VYIEILLGDAAPTLGKCSKEQVLHWLSTEAEEERENGWISSTVYTFHSSNNRNCREKQVKGSPDLLLTCVRKAWSSP